ncbi:MAG: hypothetical protein KA714_23100 [Limnoraphis sp. WC205]|nr:hypothetical protein [Limnoraphis sp. WC205]
MNLYLLLRNTWSSQSVGKFCDRSKPNHSPLTTQCVSSELWEWKTQVANLEKPSREPLDGGRKYWIRKSWAEGITLKHPMIREHLQLSLNITYPQYPVTGELEQDARELIKDSELSQWLNRMVILPLDRQGTMD